MSTSAPHARLVNALTGEKAPTEYFAALSELNSEPAEVHELRARVQELTAENEQLADENMRLAAENEQLAGGLADINERLDGANR